MNSSSWPSSGSKWRVHVLSILPRWYWSRVWYLEMPIVGLTVRELNIGVLRARRVYQEWLERVYSQATKRARLSAKYLVQGPKIDGLFSTFTSPPNLPSLCQRCQARYHSLCRNLACLSPVCHLRRNASLRKLGSLRYRRPRSKSPSLSST
jgi:hypothetical protein